MMLTLEYQAVLLGAAPSAFFWLIGGGLVLFSLQLRRLAVPKPIVQPQAPRPRRPV